MKINGKTQIKSGSITLEGLSSEVMQLLPGPAQNITAHGVEMEEFEILFLDNAETPVIPESIKAELYGDSKVAVIGNVIDKNGEQVLELRKYYLGRGGDLLRQASNDTYIPARKANYIIKARFFAYSATGETGSTAYFYAADSDTPQLHRSYDWAYPVRVVKEYASQSATAPSSALQLSQAVVSGIYNENVPTSNQMTVGTKRILYYNAFVNGLLADANAVTVTETEIGTLFTFNALSNSDVLSVSYLTDTPAPGVA